MAKDAKVQSKHPTLVASQTQTLVKSVGASEPPPDDSWSNIILSKTSRLSRSTQFIITAALILGLTMAFVGQLVIERMERIALQSAAESSAHYMGAFLEPITQELSYSKKLSATSTRALDRLMQNISINRHIVSIKIWLADGTIAYSTDKSITNQKFSTDEISGALKGDVVTYLEQLDEPENAFEREMHIPLYEIYAPLRDVGTGKIIAVGEFYERANTLEKEITRVRRDVWLVVAIATLAMLSLLFLYVRHGERIITRQQLVLRARLLEQSRLHGSNISLQRKIAKATEEFTRINELTIQRTAAELHDGPAQLLTLILIRLDDLATEDMQVDQKILESIRQAATDALREVRNLSRGMALPELKNITLTEELQLIAQRHEQRTGSKVDLQLEALPHWAPLPLKLCIYRFVQEGLNNAFHHAGGLGQCIHASYLNGVLQIEVKDAGAGMPSNTNPTESNEKIHLGLVGLRYRVESMGGMFSIESSASTGTTIRAQFKP